MIQKIEFIEKAILPGANVSALCAEYGISRQTGYKWLRRYRANGYVGLVEQSRRPASSPLATAEEIVVSIVPRRTTTLSPGTGKGTCRWAWAGAPRSGPWWSARAGT